MADQDEAAKRVVRLTKLFNAIIHGHRELKSAADGNRFLEALCAQEDAGKCVECLIAAPEGLSAVAKAFRYSRDSAFLNGPAQIAINYLSTPSLKQLYGGHFLHRVLEAIIEPPTFWNTLCEAHHAQILTQEATQAFAWLLLEVLCSSAAEGLPDVRDVAERVTKSESLLNSGSLGVRNLGQKIKHVLNSTLEGALDGPGGRHDNDFVDFRKVKILPTADEFASAERPFYRRRDAISTVGPDERGLMHLDNQFRLLREDLLGELRDDFKIAVGQKKGRRKFVLGGLRFAGLDFGSDTRRKMCSVKLQCKDDLPQMASLKSAASRKKFVTDNRNMMKHQSLGCLISQGRVLAFAKVDRDEDLLAQRPPVIVLRVDDQDSLRKTLHACKYAADLQFVQVDTAVFAYEPVLKCLQKMTEVPLQEQLLGLTPESSEAVSSIAPLQIVNKIREQWEDDLQPLLATKNKIELDAAQAESLLLGLSRKVSLIQGPPGESNALLLKY
jgi:hypothetical protein